MRFRSRLGRVLRSVKTPKFMVEGIVGSLAPKAELSSLLRLGPWSDGGYVLPKIAIQDLDYLLSPGVDVEWGFEVDVARESGCRVALIDGSVNRPGGLPQEFTFERKWLGARNSDTVMTLETWIQNLGLEQSRQLGLQIDIEGAEWNVLRHTPRRVLQQFRFIVIELHGMDWLPILWDFTTKIRPGLRLLLRDFQPVHVHANNCCRTVKSGDLIIPSVIEVSLIRRDLIRSHKWNIIFAEELDADNVPQNPSINLESWKQYLRTTSQSIET